MWPILSLYRLLKTKVMQLISTTCLKRLLNLHIHFFSHLESLITVSKLWLWFMNYALQWIRQWLLAIRLYIVFKKSFAIMIWPFCFMSTPSTYWPLYLNNFEACKDESNRYESTLSISILYIKVLGYLPLLIYL